MEHGGVNGKTPRGEETIVSGVVDSAIRIHFDVSDDKPRDGFAHQSPREIGTGFRYAIAARLCIGVNWSARHRLKSGSKRLWRNTSSRCDTRTGVRRCASMCAQSQQLDILQQLDRVEREIAEARKQAIYRNRLKDACFLQGYCDGKSSMFLNLDTLVEVNDVAPFNASCGHRTTFVRFTVSISHRDSSDMPRRVESEKENMFVRDINIVKCPSGGIVPSVVRLNLGHDAIKKRFTPGIYLNPVKGSLDLLPSMPNGKLCRIGDFVGEASANCGEPCEVHSCPQVVESISDNQGQIIQTVSEVWDFMFERLSAVWTVLDCGSATIFERINGGVHVRDMFLSPLNLQSGVPVKCAHAKEVYALVSHL
jgi:ribosomal protein S20